MLAYVFGVWDKCLQFVSPREEKGVSSCWTKLQCDRACSIYLNHLHHDAARSQEWNKREGEGGGGGGGEPGPWRVCTVSSQKLWS